MHCVQLEARLSLSPVPALAITARVLLCPETHCFLCRLVCCCVLSHTASCAAFVICPYIIPLLVVLAVPAEDRYTALLREVAERTGRLVAHWQALGFVHGESAALSLCAVISRVAVVFEDKCMGGSSVSKQPETHDVPSTGLALYCQAEWFVCLHTSSIWRLPDWCIPFKFLLQAR
jgi:hypothetical protein